MLFKDFTFFILFAWNSGSQLGMIFFLPGDIWQRPVHFWWSQLGWGRGATTGIQLVEASDAAKHPTMDKTVPHNKELYGPKCQ